MGGIIMKKFGKHLALAALLMLTAQTIRLADASADAVCFVLKEYNGRIALLEEGMDEPLAVYNTPISSLFPSDAELIRKGIRLSSRTEISQLIEDLELE